MIIDCFTYFNEKELLELRIKLLYDKVDKFVITEGNHTHKGDPKELTFLETAKSLNLPMDKILYAIVDMPNSEQNADPWVRERMQRDAAAAFIGPDDVAFISDLDEIISPEFIEYYAKVAKLYPNNILRVPLVFLCSRANLRVYNPNGEPISWSSPFMVTKQQTEKYTLSEIRESHALGKNDVSYGDIYITENNKIQEAGWHFTWMGDDARRKQKINAFLHWDEVNLTDNYVPKNGALDPLGRHDHILLTYPEENLPALINELPSVKEFLFNTSNTSSNDKKIEDILTEVGQHNNFNWEQHRTFAYWLVKELKPKVIVDLGVDFGYSSFCFSLPNSHNYEKILIDLSKKDDRYDSIILGVKRLS